MSDGGAVNPSMRASDADRERVVELLRQHSAEGRITMDEFEERMAAAYTAKTMGALAELTGDLPVDLAAHSRRQAELARQRAGRYPMQAQLRAAVASWVSLAILLNVVWLVSGHHGYWPAWPLGILAAVTAMRFVKMWGRS